MGINEVEGVDKAKGVKAKGVKAKGVVVIWNFQQASPIDRRNPHHPYFPKAY